MKAHVTKLIAVMLLIAIVICFAGCDESECEELCVGSNEIWYDDCEDCADGMLFERECAEIWCD